MKHTLFILALITATIQTFAQSPRIKLNQITKDSLTGSVLISSPTDSGMVYSRDFYISYGADTVLILGGDTIVLQSDLIAEIGDSLLNYASRTELSDSLTLYASKTELSDSTSNIRTDIPLIVSDSLTNYVSIAGTQTITGGKTFSTGIVVNEDGNNVDTRFEGDTDVNLFFLDADENKIGIGTSTLTYYKLEIVGGNGDQLNLNNTGQDFTQINMAQNGSVKASFGVDHRSGFEGIVFVNQSSATNYRKISFRANGVTDDLVITNTGSTAVGIGTTSPSEKLDVDGNARFRSIGSGTSAGALHYTSDGTLTTNTSDIRLKTNILPLENTLKKLLGVNTYTYSWINDNDRSDIGMIAQELEDIFPKLVFTNPVDGYKGIHYDKFGTILTKAIQEQQAIIEQQATEIETLKTQIQLILNEIEQIKNN